MRSVLPTRGLQALALGGLLLLSACSSYRPWINPPRQVEATTAVTAAPQRAPKPVVVAVALSGGGARAAAFGLGVLKGLKAAEFVLPGRRTSLLDEVIQISGVSGGSILAAHYAAFGDTSLERFEPDFLLASFEGRLLRELLWPQRLYQLSSPWYGRSQILAERLDELYRGMSFAGSEARLVHAEGREDCRKRRLVLGCVRVESNSPSIDRIIR